MTKITTTINTKNDSIYFHVELKVRERMKIFWDVVDERLIRKINEHIKLGINSDNNDLQNFTLSIERMIVKQVYSMVEVDKIYSINSKGIIFDDVKLTNLIELALRFPSILVTVFYFEKNILFGKLSQLLRESQIVPTLNNYNKQANNQKKEKQKAGRKASITMESDLHKKVKRITNWKKLSVAKLSLELGYSKNRLAQILDENGWSLPVKD